MSENECDNEEESQRTRSLSSNTFKDVVDEGVEDGHRLVGDTSIRVNLLQHCTIDDASGYESRSKISQPTRTLVDIRAVSLLSRLLTLLLLAISRCGSLALAGSLLRSLGVCLGWRLASG